MHGHFRQRFAGLRADAKRWGWARSLGSRLAVRLGEFSGVSVVIVRERMLVAPVEQISPVDQVDFREMPLERLLSQSNLAELNIGKSFLCQAMERGDRVFVALQSDRVIGYVFRALGGAPHVDGIRVTTNPDASYAYKSFVLPEFRGKRISPALVLLADETMRKEGCVSRVGFVAVSNIASLRVGKYAGSRTVGYAGYFRKFGFFIPFRTPGAKAAGFSFSSGRP